MATGQPLCRGLSPPVQVSLEVEVTEGSSFLLYDCPLSLVGCQIWALTPRQRSRKGEASLCFELRTAASPGGLGAGMSPSSDDPAAHVGESHRGGASGLARTLRSQDQAHSAPCWTQTCSSPTSHHSLLEGLPHTCRRIILMSPPWAVE